VHVRDTGIGIPEEHRKAIFEAFTQADMSTTRQFGGTGLGLSISNNLVELMGGRLWFESEVGAGTTFSFSVPLALDSQHESHPNFPSPSEFNGLKVLVVDDNATSRQILVETLGEWGITALTAESGHAALDSLCRQHAAGQPVQLLVTDMHMTGMDGMELVERIRAIREIAAVPTILLTTSRHYPADIEKGTALGLVARLSKPVKHSELIKAIRIAVGATCASSPGIDRANGSISLRHRMLPRSILLVEDGLANQKLAMGLLSKWGHNVSVAKDGREAIEKFKSDSFELILMDINMPGMDGLEATREIRRSEKGRQQHVPIVAMTAHALEGDRERFLAAGMDAYLAKPFRADEFHQALVSVFGAGQDSCEADTAEEGCQ
jgi:CheY-like chemotaxis protein